MCILRHTLARNNLIYFRNSTHFDDFKSGRISHIPFGGESISVLKSDIDYIWGLKVANSVVHGSESSKNQEEFGLKGSIKTRRIGRPTGSGRFQKDDARLVEKIVQRIIKGGIFRASEATRTVLTEELGSVNDKHYQSYFERLRKKVAARLLETGK